MQKIEWKASLMLTLTAVIWGFAFVAQRVAIQHIGGFTFTGIRFALGAVSLLPLLLVKNKKEKGMRHESDSIGNAGVEVIGNHRENLDVLKAGAISGIFLFVATGLQQRGMVDTTAGKAAFITGFYIILVPAMGVLFKQKTSAKTWIAAIIAIIGLYFISVEDNFTISRGDFLVFLCSFFFAAHILLINKFIKSIDALKLSFMQCLVCSALSLITALFVEEIYLSAIIEAAIPILYGGVFSVGVAYTLQVVGQKYANPTHAAIILSLESVFALIGGMLILKETLNWRGYVGCLFMLAGVLLSQLPVKALRRSSKARHVIIKGSDKQSLYSDEQIL